MKQDVNLQKAWRKIIDHNNANYEIREEKNTRN